MEEVSDLTLGVGLIVVSCLIFAAGVWLGSWHVRRQYQYGCAPDVLISYTDGYKDCKEGK